MKTMNFAWLGLLFVLSSTTPAFAASPNIDSFNIQSYIRLTNGNPTSATSGTFVFGVFKGTNCIWAKRYSGVAINLGVINHNLSGAGSNIASISNPSATPGECVGDFSAVVLNGALLNAGASAGLSLRAYSETSLDGFQPVWDLAFASVPTAMVADAANTATNAATANDLVSGMKVSVSLGASSVGKVPVLDASGKIDNSMIDQSGLTIANTQVTGLGTAATANTGTASGNVPVLNGSGKLATGVMPTYTANRVLSTDGTGAITSSLQTASTSAGAGDAGKVVVLNGSGKVDNTAIDSASLTPAAANLTGTLAVNKGGTGQATLAANALLVGNGTSAVNTLAPTNGNVVYGSGGAWTSGSVDAAGAVDKTSTQTAAGDKTWSGNQVVNGNATFNGNLTLGSGGATYAKVLQCNIGSGGMTSGTARTATCTGATTTATVFCSPTVAPTTAWVLAGARISAANTVSVLYYRYTGTTAWTTAFNCVVFQP